MKAYDLQIDTTRDPRSPATQGWCFGPPPGIASEQWPLDPHSGYPLCHGFTLLLPEDHLVHGSNITGLSFFGVDGAHNEGGPISTAGLYDTIIMPTKSPPPDPRLLQFWSHAANQHPKLYRMRDFLGCAYAVILLSEAEYYGPFCDVPDIVDHPMLQDTQKPSWLGSYADSIWKFAYPAAFEERKPRLTHTDHNIRLNASSLAFSATPRVNDPNAGKSMTDPSYESRFTEDFEMKDWAKKLSPYHIGGSMDAVEQKPKFTPHYIGFDDRFGGFNFGAGRAQFDFKEMELVWDC